MPAGMAVCLYTDVIGSGEHDNAKERWGFSSGKRHRLVINESKGASLYRHEITLLFDTANICRQLLDGKVFVAILDACRNIFAGDLDRGEKEPGLESGQDQGALKALGHHNEKALGEGQTTQLPLPKLVERQANPKLRPLPRAS